MRPVLLIASRLPERRRQLRALLADWPCYEAASPAELPRLLGIARPALLLVDADWPAGGAERAGVAELRLQESLLGLREQVARRLASAPPTAQ